MKRQKKKRSNSRGSEESQIPRFALTISEFCQAHGISLAMYYKLRAVGKGPQEAHVLTKPIITLEAAADWRKAREADAQANESADAEDAA